MRYDVIVCGSGPAGATSALFLAKKGHSVLLIDKEKFPREKTCGGVFPARIAELELFKNRTCEFFEGVSYTGRMYSPSLRLSVDYTPKDSGIFSYFAKRIRFDKILQDRALDAGAQLLERNVVENVEVTKERATVHLKNGRELECEMVVGASGIRDVAAKYLRKKEGLKEWDINDHGLALAKEYEVNEDLVEELYGEQKVTVIHLKPHNLDGYAWCFPKKDSINIGYGLWRIKDARKIDVYRALNDYIKLLKKQSFLTKDFELGKIKGALLPMKGPLKKTFSDRIVLVGDAANFVSPVSGEGVYYAVDSGRIAAEVISEALERDNCTASNLKAYQKIWKDNWGKGLEISKYLSKIFMANSERLLRYAKKDKELSDISEGFFSAIFDLKILQRSSLRLMRDFVYFDVLKK